MAEILTPNERFMRWLEKAEQIEATEAKLEFRNLYRLPSMAFYFRMLFKMINDHNQLVGHDLLTEEGVKNAIRSQGTMQGLHLAIEAAIRLAIPTDGDEDAA